MCKSRDSVVKLLGSTTSVVYHFSQCTRRNGNPEKVANLISARSTAVHRSVQAGTMVICHRGNCYVCAIALVAEIAIGGRARYALGARPMGTGRVCT